MPGAPQRLEFTAGVGSWQLHRAEPAHALRGLVVEYWEVEGSLSAFRETLLPNGCVEVMINLGPRHRVLSSKGTGTWEHGWFSGLQEHSLVIESLDGTHLVSARLHPLGATALLGSRAPAAANSIVDLEEFLGPAGETLRRRVSGAASCAERFEHLEAFLLDARSSGSPAPDFVHAAANQIEATHGNVRVSTLHETLDISRKHLAVMFARYVGVSLKDYAQLRRFIWTLGRLQESTNVNWSTLASEAGYSDQSHLVRDFRRVGAASPTEYLRRRAPDGTALLYDADHG